MKALHKDTVKEMLQSKSRFLSIVTIIALGICFFTGIKATGPTEKQSAYTYTEEQSLMDLHLISTWGFTDKDVSVIKGVQDVLSFTPAYTTDAVVEKGEKRPVFKVFSIPKEDELNQPLVLEGRMPQKPDECVVEKPLSTSSHGKTAFTLGETITMPEDQGETKLSDSLNRNTYTIVGFVRSPMYLSIERGSSTIGSGDVSYYMMVEPEVFTSPRYTDVYVQSKAAREFKGYSDDYRDTVASLKTEMETIGDQRLQANYDTIHNDAMLEINKAKRELADGQNTFDTQIEEAEAKIEESTNQLADGEEELAEGWRTFNQKMANGEAQIAASEAQLADGEAQYQQGQDKINAGTASYEQGKKEYETQKSGVVTQLGGLQQQKSAADSQITQLQQTIATMEKQDPNNPMLEQLRASLTQAQDGATQLQAGIDQIQKGLSDGQSKLDGAKNELDTGKAQLEASRKQLDEGYVQLAQGKATLEAGRTEGLQELVAAQDKLDEGRAQLEEGKAELETQRADGQAKLDDAQSKIDQAMMDLGKVELGKWYYFNRDDNPGYTSYGQDADRIDNLGNIFPLFFLLVAILVSFTTMTRMVEEQRTIIGTLKGLGYTAVQIASKYIIYSLVAASIGSVVGAIIGINLLPRLIITAYALLYQVPLMQLTIPWGATIGSMICAIAFTVGAAIVVAGMELKHPAATLMRPKAPKIGKRIFLERMTPIWNHMSFISKVTARNILRYKARFAMTVIGITGCTALILAGFGLQDSIFSIVPTQFDEISVYDGMMGLKNEGTAAEKQGFFDSLKADKDVSEAMMARQQKMNIKLPNGAFSKEAYLFIPEDAKTLESFIVLRHRTNHNTVAMDDGGAILTEKLAKDLGINVGDTVRVYSEDEEFEVTVSDIVENYIEHYIYLSPTAYQKATGKTPRYNVAYFNLKQTDSTTEDALSERWLAKGDAATVSYTTNIVKSSNDTMSSLNVVVLVMLVSAGALAFVVLYNLTNINVSERMREIATIKVLGFYDKETYNYIFRENIVLSLIGMVFGLGLGILLNTYIITTVETDVVMFGRGIDPSSYLFACVCTIGFTLIVNFIMRPVIKRVDMVESLKSIE